MFKDQRLNECLRKFKFRELELLTREAFIFFEPFKFFVKEVQFFILDLSQTSVLFFKSPYRPNA